MAKFAYNNAKNKSIGYTTYKLKCGYYLRIFFKKNTNPCFWYRTVDKLSEKLGELITVYRKNVHHNQ